MKTKTILGVTAAAASLLAGCTVGPNYAKPHVDAPAVYRGAAEGRATNAAAPVSLGDEKWQQVFQDPQLQSLIRTALQQNYDVRIAAANILAAQSQLGLAHSEELPSAAAQAGANDQRQSRSKFFGPYETSSNQLGLGAAWDLDFWGKYRRATEAARAELLGTEWARREVESTLVASVAANYFQLRELDQQLQIARRTLASRQDSLHLTRVLAQHGATSELDVRQAEQLVYAAAESIPDLERRIAQQENAISVLVGRNPSVVTRGLPLTEQPLVLNVPAGLPSSLLERRPDIRAAEQQLIAANARIGVAKAAYFPDIKLTAVGGFATSALSGLFTGPAGMWNFGGTLTEPLYVGGSLKNSVRLAEAQRQQALLRYRQTVQQAFREVSDALVGLQRDQEFLQQQKLLTQSAEEATKLSRMRYQGGAASYLEVLDGETRYFSAQLTLSQAQLNQELSLVELYRALGGGWQQ